MSAVMLLLLDYFLYWFHLAVTLFNLTGWTLPRTRKLHRICVSITLFCWLIAGLWVGHIGYCPLTDWHWDVKQLRGVTDLPNSFITYLLNQIGLFPNPYHVDVVVGATFAAIVLITGLLWAREIYKRSAKP